VSILNAKKRSQVITKDTDLGKLYAAEIVEKIKDKKEDLK